jgi:hypothetical protein
MKQNDKIVDIKCNSTGADGGKEEHFWLPIGELSKYELYPVFFKTKLQNLKSGVGHFFTRNGKLLAKPKEAVFI